MHEASLVESLLEQVRDLVARQGGGTVTRVVVETGPLSGVEPDLVALAYERLAPLQGLSSASLDLRLVPLRIRCGRCQVEQILPDFYFRCMACGERDVTVLQGDVFLLREIQFERDEQPDLPTDLSTGAA